MCSSDLDTMVALNPTRMVNDFLESNTGTAHAFNELDKFSGGMLRTSANVSDLTYRVARGDAISKKELVEDALFGLKAAAIVTGGLAAVGGMVGSMVGNEVCKHQTDAQDACRAAFTIIGAAAGGYSASSGEATFTDYLTDAGISVFKGRVVQAGTKLAVEACKINQWAGKTECAILGQIAADYIKAPPGTDWLEFLAKEAGRLGTTLLLAEAFPPNSLERQRLLKQAGIKPGTKVPPVVTPSTPKPKVPGQINVGQIALVGGAAALALYLIAGD